jgi:Zn-dependent metalloprotease
MNFHSPIQCLVPPHILTQIIHNGEQESRQWAIATLKHTERLRGHREILARYDITSPQDHGKFRIISSADNKQLVGGKIVRKEGEGLTGDPAIDEAYAYTGDTYDFYFSVFKRNSIDGAGAKLLSTVHYGNNFDNAFWNGERMIFGDGDGKIFDRFTKCLEVIGHELTHGVTNSTAQLSYTDESGALNESISDIMGCLVKQRTLDQNVKEASWIVGEGLFMPSINGKGVRSLAAPGTAYDDPLLGKDPCPATMADYVKTSADNGGIHINCTIPSHAFYLASMELGGKAWEKLGRVWFNAVTKRLGKTSTFQEFANITLKVANRVFGQGANEVQTLRKAWKSVGVL